ncbi:MAG: RIP metalloprotease, partial [Ruminococcaceae bacterium]|nr:RIP metalloprotease [Oscillospiraceae bacterium]
ENGKPVMYYGFRYATQELGFFGKIHLALLESVSMVRMVFESLGMIFSGSVTLNDVAGPVGITATMSTVAQESMSSFWYMAGLIAINLSVMNALPIPALDGGRILILLIEAVTRRKLNWKAEAILNGAVLILLLGFMLVVTANDIWRLIK